MRYGYFAFDHRKTGVNDVQVESIGFAEVNQVLGKHELFTQRLRPWALDLLRVGRHEAGLYSFVYAEVDQFNQAGEVIADVSMAWDGSNEYASPPVPPTA
jgi:hypothetical protein